MSLNFSSSCPRQHYIAYNDDTTDKRQRTIFHLVILKGSMQEPDNFHFCCFEKNSVKVFSHASVNEVLTKYYKSINRVLGSTCTKICINFIATYRFIWFLQKTRSPFYDARSASTRNISNLSRHCTRTVGSWQIKRRVLGFLILTVTR